MSLAKNLVRASPLFVAVRDWRDVRAFRTWGPDDAARLKFYAELIRPGDLVFDVGANVGNRTKVFLRLGARVVAFEPLSSCARMLRRALADNSSFTLVQKAVGEKPGTAEIRIGGARVLATLSEEWIRAAVESGRFGDEQWRQAREQVAVTTLNAAIGEFGEPAFTKIDVEGFEPQVLAGLSQPIRSGSLEFNPELLTGMLGCLDRLAALGAYQFQFSSGETMRFDWIDWLEPALARDALTKLAQTQAWGDLYFRRRGVAQSGT
jgi:FkbM family methyltransferase